MEKIKTFLAFLFKVIVVAFAAIFTFRFRQKKEEPPKPYDNSDIKDMVEGYKEIQKDVNESVKDVDLNVPTEPKPSSVEDGLYKWNGGN